MTPKTPSINFHFESACWDRDSEQSLSIAVMENATRELGQKLIEKELSLVFVDDAFIADLNHRFRGKSGPTNVLSFPDDDEVYLGDIILAHETISMEAREQHKKFEEHLQHMILHGFLHLLGYDHQTEDEATEMEALEIKILRQMGIDNPYEERNIC